GRTNNRPSNIPELTAYVRKSLKEHPILTNLWLLGGLIVIILINLAIRQIFLFGLKAVFNKIPMGNPEYKKQVYAVASRLAYIVPIVVVYMILEAVNINPDNLVRTRKVCMSLTLVCLTAALISFLNIMDIWYRRHSNTRDHTIKSGIQLIQMFAVIVTLIMIVSIMMNKSPVMLLSGLGAVAAVLILIFQDTILALVSGIQLSTNHMIQLGDWIELPSENVDGIIVDIALHTVKVQNWDMTIVTVPTRKLTVETFINWRGIIEAGSRRIKRSLNVDMNSIKFATTSFINELKNNEMSSSLIKEISTQSDEGSTLTNLDLFMRAINNYLLHHPRVNPNMTIMVRQLQPSEWGLPIEIYCFSADVNWIPYENLQTEIISYVVATASLFDLRMYQAPSGLDFRKS
ncbi:MAG: mechanosensitive ion channel, partial [Alistipes sp.]|nr:mechanosensitive ion channel [Alistipes sp.]